MPEAAPADITAAPLNQASAKQGGTTGTDKPGGNDQQQQQQQKDPEPKLDGTHAPDSVEYWKARARENETKAKAHAEALQKLEDKDKTENQRLTEQLAKAEQAQKAAQSQLLKAQVAADKGLPAGMADRLTGDTEEEIAADAETLLAAIKTAGGPPPADLKQGDRGNSSATNDVDAWIRRAAGR